MGYQQKGRRAADQDGTENRCKIERQRGRQREGGKDGGREIGRVGRRVGGRDCDFGASGSVGS